jgi:tRNA nucleotidyltransferase/poly(A) polymerase
MSPRAPRSVADFARAWTDLAGSPWRAAVLAAARGRAIAIVGGALRDAALGRPVADVDLVVDGDGEAVARRIAELLPGRFVALGGERFGAFRIVGAAIELDLWDRAGTGAVADLARRDLTIGAIAMDLGSGEVLDPFAGRADLAAGVLRATGPGVFRDDPLRVLRLARFAAELEGFVVDPGTLELARAASSELESAARERRRAELVLLFAAPGAARGQAVLEAIDAWPACWTGTAGAGSPSAVPALEAIARITESSGLPSADGWFRARIAGSLAPIVAASDLAGLLAAVARRGLVSRRELAELEKILATPANAPADELGLRREIHRLGNLWPEAFVLRVATGPANEREAWRDALASGRLLVERAPEVLAPPRWLDGDQAAAILGLSPGPALGAALADLAMAQVEGSVRTRAEAEAHLAARAATAQQADKETRDK